ncbi:hypothetical protein M406DRAFT_356375, partial [Cryphonectria parasitica EP155]
MGLFPFTWAFGHEQPAVAWYLLGVKGHNGAGQQIAWSTKPVRRVDEVIRAARLLLGHHLAAKHLKLFY